MNLVQTAPLLEYKQDIFTKSVCASLYYFQGQCLDFTQASNLLVKTPKWDNNPPPDDKQNSPELLDLLLPKIKNAIIFYLC